MYVQQLETGNWTNYNPIPTTSFLRCKCFNEGDFKLNPSGFGVSSACPTSDFLHSGVIVWIIQSDFCGWYLKLYLMYLHVVSSSLPRQRSDAAIPNPHPTGMITICWPFPRVISPCSQAMPISTDLSYFYWIPKQGFKMFKRGQGYKKKHVRKRFP